MTSTASAPGKLALVGEHALIYGYPCIVTSVDLRYTVAATKLEDKNIIFKLNFTEKKPSFSFTLNDFFALETFPKDIAFIAQAMQKLYAKYDFDTGFRIETSSPSASYGLGSSSAITVATIMAVTKEYGISLSNKDLFEIAYEVTLAVQGKASGFDVASTIYGGTVFYQSGGAIIERLSLKDLPIVIGFSGNKISTMNLVEEVFQLRENNQDIIDNIFKNSETLVLEAKKHLLANDWEKFGNLLNINQGLLDSLGVNTLQLSKQIFAAREYGALGAKLSGAGGGDCMFALVTPETRDAVKKAIENAGGYIVDIKANVEGARIE